MKKLLVWLMVFLLIGSGCLAEEIPSLRQPNDADLDAGIYDSYFDDAVFVGDSVTRQLATYVQSLRKSSGFPVLGEARFLSTTNYSIWVGSHVNLYGEVHLRYRATNVTIHGGLKWMKAGKAFVCLGLNDRAGSRMDFHVERYGKLIDNVMKENPDIFFVAQSCTPIIRGAEDKTLRREYLFAFDERLKELCAEKGVLHLDITTPLLDEDGYMKQEYAYDRLCHMNNDGLQVWLTELRRFARDQYEQGLWTMEKEAAQP